MLLPIYDKVYRLDVLQHAYELVKKNNGKPGLDRVTFEIIEREISKWRYLNVLHLKLKSNTYIKFTHIFWMFSIVYSEKEFKLNCKYCTQGKLVGIY